MAVCILPPENPSHVPYQLGFPGEMMVTKAASTASTKLSTPNDDEAHCNHHESDFTAHEALFGFTGADSVRATSTHQSRHYI